MIVAALAVSAALATVLALAVHSRFGLYLVGVTGSVACGKSTFCDGLRRAGLKVIDLDEITHRLQLPGTPTWFAILKEFSPNPGRPDLNSPLLDPMTKAINRVYLSQLVFCDSGKLASLNRIMRFPILKSMVAGILQAFFIDRCKIIFLEAPLLFESGLNRVCDVAVVVEAPLAEQLNRIKRRVSGNEDEARARIGAQMPQEEKVSQADVVIPNSGTKQDLHDEALHLDLPLRRWYSKTTMIVWLCAFIPSMLTFGLVKIIFR